MAVRQLFQLQEIDLETQSDEKALSQMTSQLGESQALVSARTQVKAEQEQLAKSKDEQRSLEWEMDDLSSKIKALDVKLYGGSIKNPKELASLQQDVNLLKARRDQLETRALELMDRVEQAEANTATASNELKKIEAEWRSQQEQLSADIESLKNKLTDLAQKRQALLAEIPSQEAELYEKLKKQKGQAVAKVEQGICRGCRISLPVGDLQQARSGNLTHCSSCGRILYLP